jgi:hypothetical protein
LLVCVDSGDFGKTLADCAGCALAAALIETVSSGCALGVALTGVEVLAGVLLVACWLGCTPVTGLVVMMVSSS